MRETIIPETHQQCHPKNVGKKSSQNIAKKRFLHSHEYRDQKMVEKNAGNNYSRNTPIVPAKKCWEKNRRKILRKKIFYIHTYIVTKNGGKNARNNFSKNTPIVQAKNVRKKSSQKSAKQWEQKMLGKKRRKNCEKTFLIFTRIS